jgi:recombination protein RecT
MNETNTTATMAPATRSANQQGIRAQAKEKENMSERFTAKVLSEFGSSVSGAMEVTDYQKRLIQGYFIMIDRALKVAEENRLNKNKNNKDHKYDEELPVTWQNVNLNDLALDLVHYARMGLDMQQDAMLYPIPYKNNKMNLYDITLMEGYNGIRYIAKKYAQETPIAETVELVYSTDTFIPHMKDSQHPEATYEFTINNAFDRGDIVGGFGFLEFADPAKNELVIMPLKAILKRKPAYASANFWGGTQKVWKDGKRVEEETEGWFEEMCRKTLIREVYSAKHLPRDPQKIDDNYQFMKVREARYAEIEAQAEIDAQANAIAIDTTTPAAIPAAVVDPVQLPEAAPRITTDDSTGEIVSGRPAAQATLFGNAGPDF